MACLHSSSSCVNAPPAQLSGRSFAWRTTTAGGTNRCLPASLRLFRHFRSVATRNSGPGPTPLYHQNGTSPARKQGIVIAEFSGMVAKPAKTPQETVVLMTDMDKRMKMIADITTEQISEIHKKSVLIGILDPMTRQHTAMLHGEGFEVLAQKVLEFANHATAANSGPTPMQLGQFGAGHGECQHQHAPAEGGWTADGGWDENLQDGQFNLIGPNTKCYNCQGFGHIARNCPQPQNPKGFGKCGK